MQGHDRSMEIHYFTTPFVDKLCTRIKLDYFPEFLTRARSPDDLVVNIPGYRQTKSYTCGFVGGLMILRYFRPEASTESFYLDCRAHDDWGISTRKAASALRKAGVGVSIKKHLHFEDIASAIEAGCPIMTSIKRQGQIQHWVVIYGVNRKTKEVFVAGDKFWFSLLKTTHKWNSFRHRLPAGVDFLVCYSKQQPGRTRQPVVT